MSNAEEIIRNLWTIDSLGVIHEPYLHEYADALGVSEEEAEEVVEDVLDRLMESGELLHDGIDYLSKEVVDRIADEEEQEIAAYQSYIEGVRWEWKMAKGIR